MISLKRITSLFIFLLISIAFTQPADLQMEYPLFSLPQDFVLDGLSGNGYQKSTGSALSTIMACNPAGSQDFTRFT
jgi:hypothetical protein